MKALEKITGINVNDLKVAGPALKQMYNQMLKDYNEKTHPKLRFLDQFMIFCLLSFVIQLFYSMIVGRDPFHALLAGLFCSLGQFALTASLRIQLSDVQFSNYSNKKALFEFILGSFLLYLSCLCLIG